MPHTFFVCVRSWRKKKKKKKKRRRADKDGAEGVDESAVDGGEDFGDEEAKEVVEGDGEDVDEDESEEDPVLAHHVKGIGSVFVTANVVSWDEEADREYVEDHHQTSPQTL